MDIKKPFGADKPPFNAGSIFGGPFKKFTLILQKLRLRFRNTVQ
jgi:hypothetical protein